MERERERGGCGCQHSLKQDNLLALLCTWTVVWELHILNYRDFGTLFRRRREKRRREGN